MMTIYIEVQRHPFGITALVAIYLFSEKEFVREKPLVRGPIRIRFRGQKIEETLKIIPR